MLTKLAPMRIVSPSQKRSFRWSPSAMEAYAFTIETEEQINRNVLTAVTGMFSTAPGLAHSPGAPNRRMTYDPIRAVKNITSEARNTHIPSLVRSEEHTSELQSLAYLVCRLLLEKKKKKKYKCA